MSTIIPLHIDPSVSNRYRVKAESVVNVIQSSVVFDSLQESGPQVTFQSVSPDALRREVQATHDKSQPDSSATPQTDLENDIGGYVVIASTLLSAQAALEDWIKDKPALGAGWRILVLDNNRAPNDPPHAIFAREGKVRAYALGVPFDAGQEEAALDHLETAVSLFIRSELNNLKRRQELETGYCDVFISYATANTLGNKRIGELLRDGLAEQSKGEIRSWVDANELNSGDQWKLSLQVAVKRSPIILLVISRRYLQRLQETDLDIIWIRKELEWAKQTGKVIIPLLWFIDKGTVIELEDLSRFDALPNGAALESLGVRTENQILDSYLNELSNEPISIGGSQGLRPQAQEIAFAENNLDALYAYLVDRIGPRAKAAKQMRAELDSLNRDYPNTFDLNLAKQLVCPEVSFFEDLKAASREYLRILEESGFAVHSELLPRKDVITSLDLPKIVVNDENETLRDTSLFKTYARLIAFLTSFPEETLQPRMIPHMLKFGTLRQHARAFRETGRDYDTPAHLMTHESIETTSDFRNQPPSELTALHRIVSPRHWYGPAGSWWMERANFFRKQVNRTAARVSTTLTIAAILALVAIVAAGIRMNRFDWSDEFLGELDGVYRVEEDGLSEQAATIFWPFADYRAKATYQGTTLQSEPFSFLLFQRKSTPISFIRPLQLRVQYPMAESGEDAERPQVIFYEKEQEGEEESFKAYASDTVDGEGLFTLNEYRIKTPFVVSHSDFKYVYEEDGYSLAELNPTADGETPVKTIILERLEAPIPDIEFPGIDLDELSETGKSVQAYVEGVTEDWIGFKELQTLDKVRSNTTLKLSVPGYFDFEKPLEGAQRRESISLEDVQDIISESRYAFEPVQWNPVTTEVGFSTEVSGLDQLLEKPGLNERSFKVHIWDETGEKIERRIALSQFKEHPIEYGRMISFYLENYRVQSGKMKMNADLLRRYEQESFVIEFVPEYRNFHFDVMSGAGYAPKDVEYQQYVEASETPAAKDSERHEAMPWDPEETHLSFQLGTVLVFNAAGHKSTQIEVTADQEILSNTDREKSIELKVELEPLLGRLVLKPTDMSSIDMSTIRVRIGDGPQAFTPNVSGEITKVPYGSRIHLEIEEHEPYFFDYLPAEGELGWLQEKSFTARRKPVPIRLSFVEKDGRTPWMKELPEVVEIVDKINGGQKQIWKPHASNELLIKHGSKIHLSAEFPSAPFAVQEWNPRNEYAVGEEIVWKIPLVKEGLLVPSEKYPTLGDALREIRLRGSSEIETIIIDASVTNREKSWLIEQSVIIESKGRRPSTAESLSGESGLPTLVIRGDGVVVTLRNLMIENVFSGSGEAAKKAHAVEITKKAAVILDNCIVRSKAANGVYIYGQQSTIHLKNSEVTGCAKNGLVVNNHAIANYWNSHFKDNQANGILLYNGASLRTRENAEVDNNSAHSRHIAETSTIINNGRSGIYAGGETTTIKVTHTHLTDNKKSNLFITGKTKAFFKHSQFSNCDLVGIYNRGHAVLTLEECVVKNNNEHGIRACDQSFLTLDRSDITFNNLAGLLAQNAAVFAVKNSRINQNLQNGVELKDTSSGSLIKGEVKENGTYGLLMMEGTSIAIEGTDISGNRYQDYNDEALKHIRKHQ